MLKEYAVRAVLFDLDDTLVHWEAAHRQYLAHVFDTYGVAERVSTPREKALEEAAHFHVSNTPPISWLPQLISAWHIPIAAEDLNRERDELFPRLTTPADGMHHVLQALCEKYPLGLITNGSSAMQRAKISSIGIERYFTCITVSGEFGYHKPHPSIFLHTLGAMGVAPQDAVFIGDDWRNDIEGALAAGMQAIHRAGGNPPERPMPDIPEISSLYELLTVL